LDETQKTSFTSPLTLGKRSAEPHFAGCISTDAVSRCGPKRMASAVGNPRDTGVDRQGLGSG